MLDLRSDAVELELDSVKGLIEAGRAWGRRGLGGGRASCWLKAAVLFQTMSKDMEEEERRILTLYMELPDMGLVEKKKGFVGACVAKQPSISILPPVPFLVALCHAQNPDHEATFQEPGAICYHRPTSFLGLGGGGGGGAVLGRRQRGREGRKRGQKRRMPGTPTMFITSVDGSYQDQIESSRRIADIYLYKCLPKIPATNIFFDSSSQPTQSSGRLSRQLAQMLSSGTSNKVPAFICWLQSGLAIVS